MKLTIATILLALAAGQASADGFYQQVVGNAPQSSQEISGEATEFTYTPLYKQVVGRSGEIAKQEKEISRVASDFSFTPLYLTVTGHSG